ncbi:chromosome segregation protein [Sphingomonas sp. Leaf17]|uniref:chromosome segregation SMC family protein n=1 Tax=Sphingomonas sp. Leaf17 TaxID=1735683 RepID=UPI000701E5AA|nr:AAA family ATPase [Sphingomonas sp. Leaf17]KQM64147.1 chromosome segregation protein [Sphingomonas sp. Leaf17]
MQIKRLRIAGFKSFVEPADLVIAPGLTGVVGPNGCGKSNLLEALRWTMGENSAKSLRGAGMDDVIFAGTATRPPRAFAEVSILAEVDGQETEVVRRIERGAGSAYRIDGRDVRARDVGLLFADAATGAHSPALVSQGRISAVIAARPADRRAMLEEAAGISGLHVRRRDAENRLRATEGNLARLDEVIADQDARAAGLRRQARAADRYRELSDRIRVAEGRMIFARWREAATAADAAKREAAVADAAVTTATAAERDRAKALLDATAALARTRGAAQAARERANDAAHALDTLRARRASAAARVADLSAAAARIVAERAREGSLAADAVDALAKLATETTTLNARAADTAAAIPAADAALAAAERTARDAEVALAQALAAQASEAAETRVATAALAAAHARHDRATRDAAQVAAALASLGAPAPLDAARTQALADRDTATDAATTARETLATAERTERNGQADRDAAETTRATARADLAAIDSDIAALRRATQATGKARLLDSVSVAPAFERALAAALGDDLETAPGAWTGAATQPGDPPPPAGAVPLTTHTVAPPALARRLSQCFVVETDDSRPLATGQRIVTRDGYLRRWDGFTSRDTGAATAQRLERLNRLRQLSDARPAAAAALVTAEAARARIDTAIAAARRTATDARAALTRADQAIRAAIQAEDRALAQIERLAGQRADLDARAARIAGDVAEATAERDRAAATRAALPDGSAAAARVATLAHEADRARAAVTAARDHRTALDRAAAADRERLAAVGAEARSWRARAGDAARRIADMDARAAEVARETAAIADRPAALDAEIAITHSAHGVARTAADTLAAQEIAADAAVRAATTAQANAAEALAAARETRAGATARHENQELRRVEMGRLSGERFECPAPVLPERLGFDADAIDSPQGESAAHERLTLERERIGPVNLIAARELAELEGVAAANIAERTELGHAVNRLRGSIGTLNREGRQRLLAAFEAVDGHFRTLFTTLFDGGQAHLALIDSDDPLEAGLEIMVQPPGKRLQSLTLLSGGEQALTAVALIFGLFLTNPAPICVLDEVDAPLDDANIERFCDLLDRMARDTATRYLVVTHNAVTMSRMHRLFGVTMIERGVSRLVSVDLRAAEGLLAE